MLITEVEKLISAIKEDSQGNECNNVKKVLEETKVNGLVNLRGKDYRSPLHVAFDQPNPNFEVIKLLLEVEGFDVSYRSNADNYLHMAARTGNKDVFLLIWKKRVESVGQRNTNGNNPFHEAASSDILLSVVKEFLTWLHVNSSKEEMKYALYHIKCALYNKEYALNMNNVSPIYYLNPRERKPLAEEILRAEKSIKAQAYSAGAHEQDEVEIPDHILYDVDVDGGEQCRIS